MIREFTEEQDELRKTVRKFLSDHSSETEVRRLMATEPGYDPEVWKTMATQLGLQGIAIPKEYGGQGFGWVELGIVL
ncbi:acyl-CoA dehydrogenase family protein [Streptomyces sp. NPDC005708]|uniref:acyl-CoA dehydrogenase family protein n=1 Tax=Streptomyces sp. NPDC005708 TaxID=3154564 RepID=UPI0033CBFA31